MNVSTLNLLMVVLDLSESLPKPALATKAKKKSAKSESLPQLPKPPGTQKKRKNTRSPPVEPITGLEQPGSEEEVVTNMTRKGSRLRKKVTFADSDANVTQAVPVPKKRLRHSKR
jgi:hypothetical protein